MKLRPVVVRASRGPWGLARCLAGLALLGGGTEALGAPSYRVVDIQVRGRNVASAAAPSKGCASDGDCAGEGRCQAGRCAGAATGPEQGSQVAVRLPDPRLERSPPAREVAVAVGDELKEGERLRILVPGVQVRVETPKGDTVTLERGDGAPADYQLGEGLRCRQRSGRAFYRILSRILSPFTCRLGEREIPLGVRGTTFSVEVRRDGAIDVAVVEGVVTVGRKGTAHYREIKNGEGLEVKDRRPGSARRLDRDTIVRIQGAVTRVETREREESTRRLALRSDDLLEVRTIQDERRRTVTSVFRNLPADPAAVARQVERLRREGIQVVDTRDPRSLWSVADQLFAERRLAEARQLYLLAEAGAGLTSDERARLWLNLGLCAHELADFVEAERRLLAAEGVLRDDERVLAALVDLYQDRGLRPQLAKANQYLDRLLRTHARSAEQALAAGWLALKLWRPDEAKRSFDEAAQHLGQIENPAGLLYATLGLGDVARQRGELEAALEAFTQTVTRARELIGQGRGSLPLHRAHYLALVRRGDLLDGIGRSSEAVAAYSEGLAILQQLLSQAPARSELWEDQAGLVNRAGLLLLRLGRGREAAERFQLAQRVLEDLARRSGNPATLGEERALALLNQANAVELQGRLTEAAALVVEARRLVEPLAGSGGSEPRPREILALTLGEQGRLGGRLGDLAVEARALAEVATLLEGLIAERRRPDLESWLYRSRLRGLAIDQLLDRPVDLAAAERWMAEIERVAPPLPGRRGQQREWVWSLLRLAQLQIAQAPEKAEAQLQRALLVAEGLAGEQGGAITDRELRLETLRRLAMLRARNLPAEGLALARRAVAEAADLAQRTATVDSRRIHGVCQSELAGLLRDQGDFVAALPLLTAASATLEGLASDDLWLRVDRASVLHSLAGALEDLGRYPGAQAAYEGSRGLFAELRRRRPDDDDLRRREALVMRDHGALSIELGRLEEGFAAYRAALATLTELAAAHPRLDLGSQRLTTLIDLGRRLTQSGRLGEGTPLLDEAVTVGEEMARTWPGRADLQTQLASALHNLSESLLTRGRAAEAAQLAARALTVVEGASEDRRPQRRRTLSFSLYALGIARSALGQPEEALTAYRRWLSLAEADAATRPPGSTATQNLAVAFGRVADELLVLDRAAEAAPLFRRSVELLEGAVAARPEVATVKRELAMAQLKLGDGAVALGHLDEALQSHRRGVALADELRRQDPTRGDLAAAFAVAQQRLGATLIELGRGDEARPALTLAAELLQRLTAQGGTVEVRIVGAAVLMLLSAVVAPPERAALLGRARQQLEALRGANREVEIGLAWCLILDGKAPEAVTLLAPLVEAAPPGSPLLSSLLRKLALAHLVIGQRELALDLLRRGMPLPSFSRKARADLADLRRRGLGSRLFTDAEALLEGGR